MEAGSSEPRQRGPTFEGTGYRLGDTEVMTAGDVFRGAQVVRPKQVNSRKNHLNPLASEVQIC